MPFAPATSPRVKFLQRHPTMLKPATVRLTTSPTSSCSCARMPPASSPDKPSTSTAARACCRESHSRTLWQQDVVAEEDINADDKKKTDQQADCHQANQPN